jgi:hypothetical protein
MTVLHRTGQDEEPQPSLQSLADEAARCAKLWQRYAWQHNLPGTLGLSQKAAALSTLFIEQHAILTAMAAEEKGSN